MRGLKFTLCLLFAAATIVGMLPFAEALSSSQDLGSQANTNLQTDGLVGKLLGKGHHDDDDDEEGNNGKHHDDDDDPEKDRPKAYDQVVELDEDSQVKIELEGRADDRLDPLTFAIVDEP